MLNLAKVAYRLGRTEDAARIMQDAVNLGVLAERLRVDEDMRAIQEALPTRPAEQGPAELGKPSP